VLGLQHSLALYNNLLRYHNSIASALGLLRCALYTRQVLRSILPLNHHLVALGLLRCYLSFNCLPLDSCLSYRLAVLSTLLVHRIYQSSE
jgi:hypothetical protein